MPLVCHWYATGTFQLAQGELLAQASLTAADPPLTSRCPAALLAALPAALPPRHRPPQKRQHEDLAREGLCKVCILVVCLVCVGLNCVV